MFPMKLHKVLPLFLLALLAHNLWSQTDAPWQIGPFSRPASGNPVIAPRPDASFVDPHLKKPSHWEALHTFNPAAIVRNGKIFVL